MKFENELNFTFIVKTACRDSCGTQSKEEYPSLAVWLNLVIRYTPEVNRFYKLKTTTRQITVKHKVSKI